MRLRGPVAWLALAAFVSLSPDAAAQAPSRAPVDAASVAQIGNWMRRMSATQQPIMAAFEKCKPALREMEGAIGVPERSQALLPQLDACLVMIEAASTQSAQLLRQMPALPPAIQARTRIDVAEVHRRSAATLDVSVRAVREMREAVRASAAGDVAGAQAAATRARALSAASFDMQILMLELTIKASDRQSTIGTSTLRLLIAQASRLLMGGQTNENGIIVGTSLRDLAPQARSATSQIRRGWIGESAEARRLTKLASDAGVKARMAMLDQIMRDIASEGDTLAGVLEQSNAGTISWSDASRMSTRLAEIEIRILQAAGSAAQVIQKAK